MDNIAIITARGGSKRIPKKNVKLFLEYPIIKYSIDAAIGSGCFSEVMVSTDDEEIAEIATGYGAVVPFMRSSKNSDDFASTVDVLVEVINSYKDLGKNFANFCCIYPTAPFVTSEKIKIAIDLMKSSGANCVLPVTEFSFPILRSLKIENGMVLFNWPEYMRSRSQDLPRSFHDCGQFYIMRTDVLLAEKTLYPENTIPFEVSGLEVQDIDTEEDWRIAEMKYKILKGY